MCIRDRAGTDTIGYHGASGYIYHDDYDSEPREMCEPFTTNDIVGCHVKHVVIDGSTISRIQFVKNGKRVGRPRYMEQQALYPTIGIDSVAAVIDTKIRKFDSMYDTKGNITKKYYNY